MGVRSVLHKEFPRGWWRSPRWWVLGMRGLFLSCVVSLAAVICLRQALQVLRVREDPRGLAQQPVPDEGWAAGVLVACLGLGSTMYLLVSSAVSMWVVAALVLWCLLNLAVATTALVVHFRSRWRHPGQWQELDYIERHAPLWDHPPQTPQEYQAVWLRIKNEEM